MTEFKQIIGRGTRVRDDYGKLWFNILDYTGSATRMFADPAFDGDPVLVTEEEINAAGEPISPPEPEEPTEDESGTVAEEPPIIQDPPTGDPRKLYVDGGDVKITTHLVYELDPDGKQLRVVRFTDATAQKVRTICHDAPELRKRWADPAQRSEIIAALAERGIAFDELAVEANQPDADPFDLLCHLAFNAPLRTRRERAQRLRDDRKDFFDHYAPEARAILDQLLEKYTEHGTAQFVIPDVLKVPPISEHGNISEIIETFGGVEKLRDAVTKLQTLLYAA